MTLKMDICNDKAKWDAFVATSPHNTIFCKTVFLDSMGEDYDLILVSEDDSPQLGAVVIKKDGRPVIAPCGPTMYQGILFSKEMAEHPSHRKIKTALETTEFMLQNMSEAYGRISFALHYGIEDLRGFQWFHYHQPELGRFRLDLSYTGIIDLKSCGNFEAYLAKVRKVRRYEYNRAGRDGLVLETSRDIDLFDRLHALTIENQGHVRSAEEVNHVRRIAGQALEKGFGEMVICRTAQGDAASAVLFIFDEKKAYYLFGANHPEFRDTNSGTYALVDQIKRSFDKGLESVDVCGINSPNRGDFKTSLGAEPFPYFTATWEKP